MGTTCQRRNVENYYNRFLAYSIKHFKTEIENKILLDKIIFPYDKVTHYYNIKSILTIISFF